MSPYNKRLFGADIMDMSQPFCYGWWRDGQYLYIGKTDKGMARLFTHNIVGIVEELLPSDEIHIWNRPTKQLTRLEIVLIEKFKPKYNKPFPFRRKVNAGQVFTSCGWCSTPYVGNSTEPVCANCSNVATERERTIGSDDPMVNCIRRLRLTGRLS